METRVGRPVPAPKQVKDRGEGEDRLLLGENKDASLVGRDDIRLAVRVGFTHEELGADAAVGIDEVLGEACAPLIVAVQLKSAEYWVSHGFIMYIGRIPHPEGRQGEEAGKQADTFGRKKKGGSHS